MRPLSGVLLLLLFICQLVTPTPIFDRDGGGFHSRSAGFGETIRDWFRELKDRIVGKWKDWFGRDSPTSILSPQDLLKIDKTLESRIPNYPGLFLDLSSLSFDPKRDWGVRIGKWYIIRKVTDDDSDSDEWDMRTFIPNLPLPPIFGTDWPPDFRKFGIPQATRPPTTTPKIESTTSRQQTTRIVTQTQSVLTPTESTMITTEAIVTSTESIPLTTQLITTSAESIATSTEILTSSESVVTNSEPVAAPTEFTLTSTESITKPTIPPTESTVLSESISSTEPTLPSVKSVEIEIDSSIESTVITTVTSTEELTAITTTESPITSTKLILPIFNKRVEENETIDRQRTTRKPRPASAEVIMF